MYLFKYQDTVDGNLAFVSAETEEEARKGLSTVTLLPLLLIGSKNLEEFPDMYKKHIALGTSFNPWGSTYVIHINNIIPF